MRVNVDLHRHSDDRFDEDAVTTLIELAVQADGPQGDRSRGLRLYSAVEGPARAQWRDQVRSQVYIVT